MFENTFKKKKMPIIQAQSEKINTSGYEVLVRWVVMPHFSQMYEPNQKMLLRFIYALPGALPVPRLPFAGGGAKASKT